MSCLRKPALLRQFTRYTDMNAKNPEKVAIIISDITIKGTFVKNRDITVACGKTY
ncbi:hypothetical protein [Marivirga sp.]|uniref:hypothetical protein n=1 Tax=Marivirga sp. TaxID=2018662 RepID=UPI0025CEAAB4|nr:hypothetical protein [Marivirga sp.]